MITPEEKARIEAIQDIINLHKDTVAHGRRLIRIGEEGQERFEAALARLRAEMQGDLKDTIHNAQI